MATLVREGAPPVRAGAETATEAGLDLTVKGLRHRFPGSEAALLGVDRLDLAAGRFAAVTGASGSGKTTLIHLLSGITAVQNGSIRWGDVLLERMGEAARDRWRRRSVGLIFQEFHLVPGLDALGNVMVSAWFDRLAPSPAQRRRAAMLLDRLEVAPRREVTLLSRGEQQRVAVARALFRDPPVLIADEPTASLDRGNGLRLTGLLADAARERGATLLAVSHDPALLEAADLRFRLEEGGLAPQA